MLSVYHVARVLSVVSVYVVMALCCQCLCCHCPVLCPLLSVSVSCHCPVLSMYCVVSALGVRMSIEIVSLCRACKFQDYMSLIFAKQHFRCTVHQYCLLWEAMQASMISQPVKSLLNHTYLQEFYED